MSSIVVKAVSRAMERIAPLRLAESWDNVGLLIESPVPKAKAGRILLTIDITPAVVAEALRTGDTAVVVAYHPAIFRPLSALTLKTPMQRCLLELAANGVSVFCPHTSLDSVYGGINDWLASGILGGIDDSDNMRDKTRFLGEAKGEEGGAGRFVTLPQPIAIQDLVQRVKSHLKLEHVDVGLPNVERPVSTVAICAGAGESMFADVDADVYFTGEMPHHTVLATVSKGNHVILCGHTNTERGYLPTLASKLRNSLAELGRDSSTTDTNSALTLTNEEKLALAKYKLEVVVSEADKHPLVRM
ncbi:NGG1p interacting factor 3 [Coniophora puteana RWD-64-598 SS2]|uniref:NGG1p interacting factor 3 n=1 Tax=Coniophora puteana (strain RWD-64-598) TaxID=741705 RepID=A0A5M3N7I2_CONPW|nr:NGG1p interacting factor 3 [Coniophora puteana RWD-64-598 SS2]EIW87399.1 NGG1p interacting factor 3 [Coniophora puteana RWD-64-598 SS2]